MNEIKENILGNDISTNVNDIVLGAEYDTCLRDSFSCLDDFSCLGETCISVCSSEYCAKDNQCLQDNLSTYLYGYYLILNVNGIIEGFDPYIVDGNLLSIANITVSAASQSELIGPILKPSILTMSAVTGSDGITYFVAMSSIDSFQSFTSIKYPDKNLISTNIKVPGHKDIITNVYWNCITRSDMTFSELEIFINLKIYNPNSDESNTVYVEPNTYSLRLIHFGDENTPQDCIAKYSPFKLILKSQDNNTVSFHCFMKRIGKYHGDMIGEIKLQTPYKILTSYIERPGYNFVTSEMTLPILDGIYFNMNSLNPISFTVDDSIMTIGGLKKLFPNINLTKAPFDLYIEDNNGNFILDKNQLIKFTDIAGIRENANLIPLGIDSEQTRTIILAPGISVSPELYIPTDSTNSGALATSIEVINYSKENDIMIIRVDNKSTKIPVYTKIGIINSNAGSLIINIGENDVNNYDVGYAFIGVRDDNQTTNFPNTDYVYSNASIVSLYSEPTYNTNIDAYYSDSYNYLLNLPTLDSRDVSVAIQSISVPDLLSDIVEVNNSNNYIYLMNYTNCMYSDVDFEVLEESSENVEIFLYYKGEDVTSIIIQPGRSDYFSMDMYYSYIDYEIAFSHDVELYYLIEGEYIKLRHLNGENKDYLNAGESIKVDCIRPESMYSTDSNSTLYIKVL